MLENMCCTYNTYRLTVSPVHILQVELETHVKGGLVRIVNKEVGFGRTAQKKRHAGKVFISGSIIVPASQHPKKIIVPGTGQQPFCFVQGQDKGFIEAGDDVLRDVIAALDNIRAAATGPILVNRFGQAQGVANHKTEFNQKRLGIG